MMRAKSADDRSDLAPQRVRFASALSFMRKISIMIGIFLFAFSDSHFSDTNVIKGKDGERPAFSCTEVLGFSQTMEWFGALSIAERRKRNESLTLAKDCFLPRWQGRFQFGASVEFWKDADYAGWEGAYKSELHCDRSEVDRVVFTVSGVPRTTGKWTEDIKAVIELIRQKYPAAKQIVLQAVVGAEEGQCANIRAAQNHPSIVAAIESVAKDFGGLVVAGLAPKVGECSHFVDNLGHLTGAGARYLNAKLAEFYRQ